MHELRNALAAAATASLAAASAAPQPGDPASAHLLASTSQELSAARAELERTRRALDQARHAAACATQELEGEREATRRLHEAAEALTGQLDEARVDAQRLSSDLQAVRQEQQVRAELCSWQAHTAMASRRTVTFTRTAWHVERARWPTTCVLARADEASSFALPLLSPLNLQRAHNCIVIVRAGAGRQAPGRAAAAGAGCGGVGADGGALSRGRLCPHHAGQPVAQGTWARRSRAPAS